MRNGSLRGEVRAIWEESGKPKWNAEKTINTCSVANNALLGRRLNPAPKFREAITRKDNKYIRQWVMGCHFEWLNPRK
jgi:hypothetical protein